MHDLEVKEEAKVTDSLALKKVRRSDLLKVIAILTMVIDHTGALLYPDVRMFRTIGRISFPIFVWLLVQGFIHTSDRKKYGLRFLYFALAAEIPYAFLNGEMLYEPEHYNVMYLLLLGLILLSVVEKAGVLFKERKLPGAFLLSLVAFALVAFPDVVQYLDPEFALSYGTYGLVMTLLFYWMRHQPVMMVISYILLSYIEPYRTGVYYRAVYFSPEMSYMEAFKSYSLVWDQISTYKDGFKTLEGYFFQARSMVGLLLILLLSKNHVPIRLPKYLGYGFYPIHIAIIVLIRVMNGGPLG